MKHTMKNLYYKTTNYLFQNPIITVGMGRILGILVVLIYVLCQGCSTNPRYTEGTNLSLGAYLPVDGQLMGIEIVNYLNGCSIRTSTNQSFQVSRTYAATNDWLWGMMKTSEGSDTKIQVGCSTTNNVQNSK